METKPQIRCLLGAGFWASFWVVVIIISVAIGLGIRNVDAYEKISIAPILLTTFVSMFSVIVSYLIYRMFYLQRIQYIISDKGINKKGGIIALFNKNIPWHKVTNTIVDRGLTSRILRLSDLGIHTAGSGSDWPEMVLFALDKDEAEEINNLITDKLEKLKDKISE